MTGEGCRWVGGLELGLEDELVAGIDIEGLADGRYADILMTRTESGPTDCWLDAMAPRSDGQFSLNYKLNYSALRLLYSTLCSTLLYTSLLYSSFSTNFQNCHVLFLKTLHWKPAQKSRRYFIFNSVTELLYCSFDDSSAAQIDIDQLIYQTTYIYILVIYIAMMTAPEDGLLIPNIQF